MPQEGLSIVPLSTSNLPISLATDTSHITIILLEDLPV